ncbi:hypothetical protein BC567DRAFT_234941 [Phyllosticta citribraziliensis]
MRTYIRISTTPSSNHSYQRVEYQRVSQSSTLHVTTVRKVASDQDQQPSGSRSSIKVRITKKHSDP